MPGTPDPEVRLRRLLGVCAWSAVLGAVGLIIGARVVFGIFTEMPLWYWFLILVTGIPGVVATFAAFATLHKGQLPWKLLRAASAAEGLAFLATILS
jgi:MFS family permease